MKGADEATLHPRFQENEACEELDTSSMPNGLWYQQTLRFHSFFSKDSIINPKKSHSRPNPNSEKMFIFDATAIDEKSLPKPHARIANSIFFMYEMSLT
jgi:hypothetical protein